MKAYFFEGSHPKPTGSIIESIHFSLLPTSGTYLQTSNLQDCVLGVSWESPSHHHGLSFPKPQSLFLWLPFHCTRDRSPFNVHLHVDRTSLHDPTSYLGPSQITVNLALKAQVKQVAKTANSLQVQRWVCAWMSIQKAFHSLP